MSVYNKILSSSPFIKANRPDNHYEPFTDSENYALDMLIDFVEDLIHIAALAKALHVLINYGQIEFDGSLNITATDKSTLPEYLKSMVCTIDPDEVTVSVDGFEKNDAGGDSFTNYYIRIGESDEDYDIVNSLDSWKHMFVNSMNANPGFEIIDLIEFGENEVF